MLRKTFEVLKKNPVLILFYALSIVVFIVLTVLIMPSGNISKDPIVMLMSTVKMFALLAVEGILGIVFFAGFGNMLREAVVGKTYSVSFGQGIKKYFVKLLLFSLLMFAFYIGFSLIFGMFFAIIGILMALLHSANTGSIESATAVMSVISMIVILVAEIFLIPLILLWIPALFFENDGVFECLKRGFKAGIKNYWTLTLVTLILIVPSSLYGIIRSVLTISNHLSINYSNIFYSPWYWVSVLISSTISIVILVLIFVFYNEKRAVLAPATGEVIAENGVIE